MSIVLSFISSLLSVVLKGCFRITHNYGLSIILFTLFTKLILFPLSVFIQKNSIKMIQMQPQIDALKIKYIDDKDKYVDEQIKLYKDNHYHSSIGIIPLIIQLVFVLGLLELVYNPLTYLLDICTADINVLMESVKNIFNTEARTIQIDIIHQFQHGNIAVAGLNEETVSKILSFPVNFLGLNLSTRPSLKTMDIHCIIPVLSGLSAFIMCFVQNRVNILQITSGKLSKYGMTVFMVAFSAYFAFLVPAGVGLYWIFGNLFAVPSMVLVNKLIPPEKYIDFDYLKKIQEQKNIKEEKYRKYHKTEKADYKRFSGQKDLQLVIYSESKGYYKYYSGMIDYICNNSDIEIHYITSDPEDSILFDERSQIKSYYISQDKYLIPLFMKLDCDICVMTMPDLEKYHIKRSRVRKDIEYIYVFHGMASTALTLRKGSLDWYDTIFCHTVDSENEIRKMEELYGTKKKTIVEAGYLLIDDMIAGYSSSEHKENNPKKIVIAPSWQPDNLIDVCGEQILDLLVGEDYDVIMRPHPQMVKHSPEKFEELHKKYDGTNVEIQTDSSSASPVMEADVLITDWSGISYEFAFATGKPVLFIDTPMKIMNPDYEKISPVPIDISLRNVIGKSLRVEDVSEICVHIKELIDNKDKYSEDIKNALNTHVFNVGKSNIVYGRYIIKKLTQNKK